MRVKQPQKHSKRVLGRAWAPGKIQFEHRGKNNCPQTGQVNPETLGKVLFRISGHFAAAWENWRGTKDASCRHAGRVRVSLNTRTRTMGARRKRRGPAQAPEHAKYNARAFTAGGQPNGVKHVELQQHLLMTELPTTSSRRSKVYAVRKGRTSVCGPPIASLLGDAADHICLDASNTELVSREAQ